MNKKKLTIQKKKVWNQYTIRGGSYYSHRAINGIYFSPANSWKHEQKKAEICYNLLKEGKQFITEALHRKTRLITDIKDKNLIIDGYNVLFTVLNYRLGRLVFISTDGILRDAGSLHGKIRNNDLFYDCITLLFDFFAIKTPAYLNIFLDSPVSHSAKHKNIIDKALGQYFLNGSCKLVKSPDIEIKQNNDGIICSSDTAIIDRTENHIADIPRAVLENNFRPELFKIDDILNQEIV